MDIFEEFSSLGRSDKDDEFNAFPISHLRSDFLAKGESGAPVFLLFDEGVARFSPEIRYRNLSAKFHVTCHVTHKGEGVVGQFCIVSCDEGYPELYELFIRCVSAAAASLPAKCETSNLEACIYGLHELFRALSIPGGREISGLWSELFVILMSGEISDAVRIWRAVDADKFDFSTPLLRIEVKSTLRTIRAHDCALEQLRPPSNGRGYLVSVMLQELSGGVGILDLARRIDEALEASPDLKIKLWRNVASTLGEDFSAGLDRCFDLEYAERSITVFHMDDVPRPRVEDVIQVSSVRFVVDLTSIAGLRGQDALKALRGHFSAGGAVR